MTCPIARSLEQVGEWWSMLILRDAFAGKTRFDDVPAKPRHRLEHADSPACQRWSKSGMLERRPLQRAAAAPRMRPHRARPRLRTVLIALLAFGQRHFAIEGGSGARVVDVETGEIAEPMLVDRRSGKPLAEPDFRIVRGKLSAARLAKSCAVRRKAPACSRSRPPERDAKAVRRMSSLAVDMPSGSPPEPRLRRRLRPCRGDEPAHPTPVAGARSCRRC